MNSFYSDNFVNIGKIFKVFRKIIKMFYEDGIKNIFL